MPTFQSQSIAGYNGVMYVSTDAGSTWTAVGELRDVKIKIANKMLDATSHSSGGYSNNNPGNQEWSATVGQLAIFADAGQVVVAAAVAGKTRLKFRFDPAGTATGKPRREGFGYIADWEESQPLGDLETQDLSITGDGQLTLSTQ